MTTEGIGLDAQAVKLQGHAQEALHAVHMDGRPGRLPVPQRGNFRQRLGRAGLVVHLHDGDQEDILVQHGLQLFQVDGTGLPGGNLLHGVAHLPDFLGAGRDRRMFHGGDQHPARLSPALQVAQERQVIRLGSAGGEDDRLPGGTRRLQAEIPHAVDPLLDLQGRLI